MPRLVLPNLAPCIRYTPNSNALNAAVDYASATEITFEGWVRFDDWHPTVGQSYVWCGSSDGFTTAGARVVYFLRAAANNVQLIAYAKGSTTRSVTIDLAGKYTAQTIHLCVTFSNATGIVIYINGVAVGSTALACTDTLGVTTFTVGSIGGSQFARMIAGGVRAWKRALTAAEALAASQNAPVSSTSLLLDVPCTDGVGSTATDRSGNGFHLTLSPDAKWYQPGIVRPRLKSVLVDPTDIPGCCVNLDASRLSLANNDPVASFTDFSGAGAHATAAGAARPTYKTAIQNGLPGVLYDGVANVSDIVAATLGITDDWTVFLVGQTVSLGGALNEGGIFGNSFAATRRLQFTHYQANSFIYCYPVETTSLNTNLAKAAGSPFLVECSRNGSDLVRLTMDGAERMSMPVTAALGTTVGDPYKVGRNATTGNYWNGYVHQIVAYRRRLLDVERKKVLEMLNSKWAVV